MLYLSIKKYFISLINTLRASVNICFMKNLTALTRCNRPLVQAGMQD